jgi:hypothetical protein
MNELVRNGNMEMGTHTDYQSSVTVSCIFRLMLHSTLFPHMTELTHTILSVPILHQIIPMTTWLPAHHGSDVHVYWQ